MGEALDLANRGPQPIESNEADPTEPGQAEPLRLGQDLPRHLLAQLLATLARSDQGAMELSQEELLRPSPHSQLE